MRILLWIISKLARRTALCGAGSASAWNSYQPELPEILK